ncbi:SGNH/GDSL hydrolase family protein [bacterium]|nr:SGNH/GDSL hydrolase family protein [bacterium]
MNQNNSIKWTDAATLTIEGKGWTDTVHFYDRFPAKAKAMVNETLWKLSRYSAGIAVRFISDSPAIHARWKLEYPQLGLTHMPATGVSGVDLYVRHQGRLRWLATGFPLAVENESELRTGMTREMREYALYLPIYNAVESVEIGIADGSDIQTAPPRKPATKPVVFYGTSILHGISCSRPGMAYPSIIGRKLDIQTINLGFAGSAKCEKEVSDLLAELDPSVYVIDCMPNMDIDDIDQRLRYLMSKLKRTRPETPVILVEEAQRQWMFMYPDEPQNTTARNLIQKQVYEDCVDDWNGRLYYIECHTLLNDDGEQTVDGTHPTDLGLCTMAKIIAPVIGRVISCQEKSNDRYTG